MKGALYMNDSYLREFNANVVEINNERFIVLDNTAFFPRGGGVPNDIGKFIRVSDNKIFEVVSVSKQNGRINQNHVDSARGRVEKKKQGIYPVKVEIYKYGKLSDSYTTESFHGEIEIHATSNQRSK